MPRYVLYDFDADELATTTVYSSYEEAAADANELDNVMVVALNVGSPEPDAPSDRRRLPGPKGTSTDRCENVGYTLCRHCDHFVEANEPPDSDADKFLHLEEGQQEFDHAAEPSAQVHTLAQWRELRPDLFKKHRDGRIGPNSKFHSRRGKLD